MTALGLSQKQVDEVKRTWGIVSQNLRENGIEILMKLFTTYPKYKDLFSRFDNIPLNELRDTTTMRAHATSFMRGMCTFVDNLEDKETLVKLIQDNVGRHFKRSIRFEHYKNTLGLVEPFLGEALSKHDQWSEDASKGWKTIIEIMTSVIKAEVDKLSA